MRPLLFAFLAALMLTLTGCFEVIEEITLNDDGSGQVTMTVNISRSKTKLNSIMLMDSINNYKVPSKADITENMSKMIAEIKSIRGVSNVSHQMDFDDFIFSVSCDFRNVDVLNDVITHFATERDQKKVSMKKQFTYDANRKVFTRSYDVNLSKEINRVNQKDREVLEGATVTSIYRFESPIVSAKNSDSKIAGNKKAVMLKVAVTDMISNKKNMKNTITLN